MARRQRIEYEGAIYHVISRGNYRSPVFASEKTRAAFLSCLGEAAEKSGWIVHAWCIMSNHYHLCVETPQANLVAGMRWLQSTFCLRFNRFRNERGHVFQGRYRALLVDGGAIGTVSHYIHLNPVRARLTPVAGLPQWKWTSLHMLFDEKARAAWFSPEAALQDAGRHRDTPSGRKGYLAYLEWLQENEGEQKKRDFERMSKGWAVGPRDFKLALINEYKDLGSGFKKGDMDSHELAETAWEKKITAYLDKLKKSAKDLQLGRKVEPWKIAIAAAMKKGTTASNPWLAERLNMGSPFRLSREVSIARRKPASIKVFALALAMCKV